MVLNIDNQEVARCGNCFLIMKPHNWQNAYCWKEIDSLKHSLSIAKEEIETAKKAFLRYGWHDKDCPAGVPTLNRFKCNCGYDEALTPTQGEERATSQRGGEK